jgi:ubiquinol-cytochrome c reductase iron-sulfur subunit
MSKTKSVNKKSNNQVQDKSKRDFVTTAAYTTAGVGAACLALPLVDSMNPADDVAALASVEVNISNIKIGEEKKVMWRGKPIFIKRRSKWDIAEAQKAKLEDLKDPQTDEDRVKKGKEEWLITIGICTHLGCIPMGNSGEYKGWFCPCHGSVYDTSGRIRKGPAPKNLAIPPYEFTSDNIIKIG